MMGTPTSPTPVNAALYAGQYPVVYQYPPQVIQNYVPEAICNGSVYNYNTYPARIVCQFCQEAVTTTMEHKSGVLTVALSGLLCFMGMVLGCCLIPFCIDGTKDVEHRCPRCGNIVGLFNRGCC